MRGRRVGALTLALTLAGCSPSSTASPLASPLAEATALEAMTPASRSVVESAHVRFLLLPSPHAEQAVATSGPHWSALSARAGPLTISLSGTDVTHDARLTLDEVQRAEPTDQVRGAPARFLYNEGIRSVAWNERGVDWSLEVECYEPETDARCTEDTFLADLAERLTEAPQ